MAGSRSVAAVSSSGGPSVDRLLAILSLDVETVIVCDISKDARCVVEPSKMPIVHYVLRGEMLFQIAGHGEYHLKEGSVLIVPGMCAQTVFGSPEASIAVRQVEACHMQETGLILLDASFGQSSAARMICGQLRGDLAGTYGPVGGLISPIEADFTDSDLVRLAFQTIFEESRAPSVLSRTLTSTLMKTCLTLVLRRHLTQTGLSNFPAALLHPGIGRVVNAVVEAPAAPHTVSALANLAGRSRAAFSRAFVDCIGIPPMDFVRKIRLSHARRLLAATPLPVENVAWQVGYASRSRFSRAFRTEFGMDPTAYRRIARTVDMD